MYIPQSMSDQRFSRWLPQQGSMFHRAKSRRTSGLLEDARCNQYNPDQRSTTTLGNKIFDHLSAHRPSCRQLSRSSERVLRLRRLRVRGRVTTSSQVRPGWGKSTISNVVLCLIFELRKIISTGYSHGKRGKSTSIWQIIKFDVAYAF